MQDGSEAGPDEQEPRPAVGGGPIARRRAGSIGHSPWAAALFGGLLAVVLLWGTEATLALLRPDPFLRARARAQAAGRVVDLRPRSEVVESLRRAGIDAVPRIVPASLLVPDPAGELHSRLASRGEELLPLAGIGSRTTVLCAEAGPYAVFESDPHGLRNPPEMWTRRPIELALVGDSFALGECVGDDETIAAALRRRWPATVNLGYTGHSPLLELAALVEYGPGLAPGTTLWLYFENDLSWFDLERSAKSPLLMRYLEPGFTQDLSSRRAEIDAQLLGLVAQDFAGAEDLRADEHAIVPARSTFAELRSVVDLERLRRLLGRLRPRSGVEAAPARFELFEAILERARALTSGWGGALVVVYLPGVWQFDPFAGIPGWAGPHVRDAVREAAHRQGLPFVDVSQAFAAHADPLSLYAYPGQSDRVGAPHMNGAGYAWSAAVIAEALSASSADRPAEAAEAAVSGGPPSTRRSQISRQ